MLGSFLGDLAGEDGNCDLLNPVYVERACAAIGLPDEITEAVRHGAARIREDAALSDKARQFHRELFVERLPHGEVNERLRASGPHSGMLAAVVYMGALPQTISWYESKGIPENVLVDTLQDMAVWMRHYKRYQGEWGLGQTNWLIKHWTGKLFRLGRLQFIFTTYRKPVIAFRHRQTGRIAALSDSVVRYRADGQVDGTNGISDPEHGWTSVYTYDGNIHTGHLISKDGSAVRSPVRLSDAEWELVLEPGDTVLDVHIPEGGKMSHELCRDSYGQAVTFAARHFPEVPYKGFVCSSWLLGPVFKQLLPADSNIVRFQSDYYVTPIKSDEDQTLERVFGFGTKLDDLPRLPRETTLQRIVYDHLAAGGRIYGAAGFLLKDHSAGGTPLASEVELGQADT
ncbi:acyltransferase domain-containing protein [Paenibacillus oceani]|uniref:DUF5596 domain-containing protein n=1 Tax=Paenibacillus oceani TaxID=2772510 RepID=A0A927H1P2_9BACL|nr:acyltransferase domain-containing protein [Paenibacillus oceani]MBD2864543.1 DUF5596 domain-containing protein [Paenibacillus oceani]